MVSFATSSALTPWGTQKQRTSINKKFSMPILLQKMMSLSYISILLLCISSLLLFHYTFIRMCANICSVYVVFVLLLTKCQVFTWKLSTWIEDSIPVISALYISENFMITTIWLILSPLSLLSSAKTVSSLSFCRYCHVQKKFLH